MFEAGHPAILNAYDIGHVAMRTMRDLGRTRVGAVFQSSFYLESPGPWVCVTDQTADMGPLSVRVDAPGSTDWRDCGIRRGTPANVDANLINVHPGLRITCYISSPWTPALPTRFTSHSLRRGLAYTAEWARTNLGTNEGLGCFILPHPDRVSISATATRAIHPIEQLRQWLVSEFVDTHRPVQVPTTVINELPGLGPGLTPSGDDFLGGAMVALHLTGCGDTARRLSDAIKANSDLYCNPISASHLEAAAEGSCSAPIHAVLSAILAADTSTLSVNLARIGGIGHTSGWDTLAGAVTVLRVWP
jgi:hypothetical protein